MLWRFQGLYESSVAYGMRKALRSEQLKAELNKRVSLYLFTVCCFVLAHACDDADERSGDAEARSHEESGRAEKIL